MEKTRYSKSDLVDMVSDETGQSKRSVKVVVDSLFDKMGDLVSEGNSVTIQGFARFFTKEAKPRQFRKIHTDEVIQVAARDLPKTKFSKKFVDRVKSN